MTIRQMTMKDADRMLEWKNYPETRKFAIKTHEEIKREDHFKWLEDNIQFFHVVEFDLDLKGKVLAGAVRLEQSGEVSIWIDRAFWGQGVATEILKRATIAGSTAKIVNGNIASFRAFVKAGFIPKDYIDNYYILEKP